MTHRVGRTSTGWLLAAAVAGLTVAPLAHAQAGTGTLVGAVAQCTNNSEVPLANAVVSVDGVSVSARTDNSGEFTLSGLPAPKVYDVTISGAGQSGSRSGVTLQPNQTLDIGVVDLGSALGCGSDQIDNSPIPAAAPTFTPVAPTSTPAPAPTNTPVPTVAPAPADVTSPGDAGPPPSDMGPEPSTVDVPPPPDTSPDADVSGLSGPDSGPS